MQVNLTFKSFSCSKEARGSFKKGMLSENMIHVTQFIMQIAQAWSETLWQCFPLLL